VNFHQIFSPIGRLFTLGSFKKITEVVHCFYGKGYASILTKMGWATFWAIFLQIHLATLTRPETPF
jgi:hypothetical protein